MCTAKVKCFTCGVAIPDDDIPMWTMSGNCKNCRDEVLAAMYHDVDPATIANRIANICGSMQKAIDEMRDIVKTLNPSGQPEKKGGIESGKS